MRVLLLLACLALRSLADPQSDLFAAARSDDTAALAAALAAGADKDARGSGGQTALMSASLSGSVKSVQYLLSQGASPHIGEDMGYTPLHGAGFQGRAAVARVLLNAEGVPNTQHSDGFFAVHRALWGQEARHTETVKVFLENGDFGKLTAEGKSLLQVGSSNARTMQLLKDWSSAAEEL